MNSIRLSAPLCLSFLTLASGTAAAANFDGTQPLVCASIYATECVAETQQCSSGAPWMINFPVFTEIDFKAKTLSTTRHHEVDRVSKIEEVQRMPSGYLSIQGKDGDYSWSAMISEETGAMTLSVAGAEIGFIVFGACTTSK